jgi:hypothetical protein
VAPRRRGGSHGQIAEAGTFHYQQRHVTWGRLGLAVVATPQGSGRALTTIEESPAMCFGSVSLPATGVLMLANNHGEVRTPMVKMAW